MGNKKKNTSVDTEVSNNEEKKELKTDTTSVSIINTRELNTLIEEDIESGKEVLKPKKHIFVHTMLVLLLLVSLGSFGVVLYDKASSISAIINSLFITIFTILFVVVSITYKRNNKNMILFACLALIGYFVLGLSSQVFTQKTSLVPNFSGKSITEVMKWAKENKIVMNQEYEYSDMVDEYHVISQSLEAGKKVEKNQELTISISEGPNPSKEIMVPNMITWDTERVIQFVKENYLSNVIVEFVQSDKAKDTVIEQSASGSFKRDDELKLTFSYGEELESEEIALINFKDKSRFEVEFYMKQHQLKYSFIEEFNQDTKRGYAFAQSVAAGETVRVNETEIQVTISKGPEIKVPDFSNYSMEEASEWAIQNKVKINFSNQYDDTIVENHVISSNYVEGEVIEQGTIVKLAVSRGSLKMPKFDSLNDFYLWANKYGVPYEEVQEFNDTVAAGEVISYSYKAGDVIKNKDSIIVKVSSGVRTVVPNVVGLTKSEAISKLEKAGLKYSFTYTNSSIAKDKVVKQSFRSGSEVSSGTTITVTLSNGKGETSNNNNSNSNNNNSNNGGGSSTPTPQPTCKEVTVYIYDELLDFQNPTNTCTKIKNRYPELKFSCQYVADGGLGNGMLKNTGDVDGKVKSTCETVLLQIVRN